MARPVNHFGLIAVVAAALMIAPILASPAGAATAIGQIASSGAKLDGVAVPSGTTLMGASLVESGSNSVVLHLRNGQVVGLRSRSSARLDSLPSGAVLLVVESGGASVPRSSGGALNLAENSIVVLSQNGEVGKAPAGDSEGLDRSEWRDQLQKRGKSWDSDSDRDSDSSSDTDTDTDTDSDEVSPTEPDDSDSDS